MKLKHLWPRMELKEDKEMKRLKQGFGMEQRIRKATFHPILVIGDAAPNTRYEIDWKRGQRIIRHFSKSYSKKYQRGATGAGLCEKIRTSSQCSDLINKSLIEFKRNLYIKN